MCPTGCSTCTSYTWSGTLYVTCNSCYSGVTRYSYSGTSRYYCACTSTQYMTSSSPPTCVNCDTGCSGCASSSSSCTGCIAGYFISGSTCISCMPVCKTCSDSTTCSSCLSNLTFIGSACGCSSSYFLDPVSITCQSCSYFHSSCDVCSYDPTQDPVSPTNILCSDPSDGFYLINGSVHACGAYCDACTSNTVCTTCQNTFQLNTTTFEC